MQYLEEVGRSVLDQGYPNLEYIVTDGGSTDGSVEVIRKYQHWLAYGEVMAWFSADAKYLPWAFQAVASVFRDCPGVEWLTRGTPLTWNEAGRPIYVGHTNGYGRGCSIQGGTCMVETGSLSDRSPPSGGAGCGRRQGVISWTALTGGTLNCRLASGSTLTSM